MSDKEMELYFLVLPLGIIMWSCAIGGVVWLACELVSFVKWKLK